MELFIQIFYKEEEAAGYAFLFSLLIALLLTALANSVIMPGTGKYIALIGLLFCVAAGYIFMPNSRISWAVFILNLFTIVFPVGNVTGKNLSIAIVWRENGERAISFLPACDNPGGQQVVGTNHQ